MTLAIVVAIFCIAWLLVWAFDSIQMSNQAHVVVRVVILIAAALLIAREIGWV